MRNSEVKNKIIYTDTSIIESIVSLKLVLKLERCVFAAEFKTLNYVQQ